MAQKCAAEVLKGFSTSSRGGTEWAQGGGGVARVGGDVLTREMRSTCRGGGGVVVARVRGHDDTQIVVNTLRTEEGGGCQVGGGVARGHGERVSCVVMSRRGEGGGCQVG